MKVIKTASGKQIKISKSEWEIIGKTAGWFKKAMFNATEYAELGPTPSGEDCAQVGSDDYHILSRIEGKAYLNQLRRMFLTLPENVRFSLKSFPHDFGTYHEAVVIYPADNEEAENFAFEVQNNIPEYWDSEAKNELQTQGYFEKLNK